jgi:site-specific recombinase XerD
MPTHDTWRERLDEDMRLHDFRPKTRESYAVAARQFVDWFGKDPVLADDADVRTYLLYLRDEKKLAPSTINVALCGLRFFFAASLGRDWPVFGIARVNVPHRLPVVLSRPEVFSLLAAVRDPVRRTALATIYACGLRLNEGLGLETGDLDADRLLVWVRDAKGAKDRAVPLPRPLLARLRTYWKTERPKSPTKYLFVARGATTPLHETTLQKTFSAARADAGLRKPATTHTLRHSYGTHLLEAGISLRTIQAILGHKSLRTTMVYLHVTTPGVEHVQATLDRLMADL